MQRSGHGPNNLRTNILEGILCCLGRGRAPCLRNAWCNTLVRTLRIPQDQFWDLQQHDFIVQMVDDHGPVYWSTNEEWAMKICVARQLEPTHYWDVLQEATDVLWMYALDTDYPLGVVAELMRYHDYRSEIQGLSLKRVKVVWRAMKYYAWCMT